MIVVFSGTGNSMFVARLLSGVLKDEIVELPAAVDLPEDGRLIWVFPIYSWGLPPIIVKAIESLPEGNGMPTFMVATCGDDIGQADRQWRKAVARRGYRPIGAFSVQMPNTYVLMKGFNVDSEKVANIKISNARETVANIALAINNMLIAGAEGLSVVTRGSFPRIKSRIIYPWFMRYATSPEPFFADDSCVGCEKCARYCPLGNITMDPDNRPQWGNDCTLCLRCYHICPTHAVCYSTATRGKGQWQGLMSELKPRTTKNNR